MTQSTDETPVDQGSKVTKERSPRPYLERQRRPPSRNWNASIKPELSLFDVVLGIALVGVGCAQALIYLRQTSIMKMQTQIAATQNNITIAVNRAVVDFHAVDITIGRDNYTYDIKLGNDGNLPAKVLKVSVECIERAVALDEPFSQSLLKTLKVVPDQISAKGETELTPIPRSDCEFPIAETAKVIAGTEHIYFIGQAIYLDGIDPKPHLMQVAKELVIDTKSFGLQKPIASAISVGRHNCADDDCPK